MAYANTRTSQQPSTQQTSSKNGNWLNEMKSIRELNQMRLFMHDENKNLLEFMAYVEGDLDAAISIPMSDFNVKQSSLWTAAFNVLGYAPAFDMPRFFMFQGSKPLEFTISAYLKGDTSLVDTANNETFLNKFYMEPLQNLFRMCLPIPTDGTLLSLKKVPVVGDVLSGIGIFEDGSAIASRLDEIRLMSVPLDIDPFLNKNNRMKLQLGKSDKGWALEFPDIMVTSLRLRFGKLIMDAGYPDRINVQLGLETLRPVTTDLINNFLGK